MLVGPTGSGKTKCYEVLKETSCKLKEENYKDEWFQKVKYTVLNPKAISMGEMYGEVDVVSQEWTDGLASKIMRNASKETDEDKTWVVFDGPVDALWIENMNTVLDDNMTLCLANGQRIKLRQQMRMLFEVQDLSVASPATVSRCGMVYMTQEELGWRPYIKSWLDTHF
jgi:dynein heavy chain